jgi:hypothetical protein
MKRILITGMACVAAAVVAEAQENSVRYDADRDRTMVAHHDHHEGNWVGYGANELNFSIFGTGTVGEDTLDNPSSKRIERDGQLGAGIGVSYFFHRYVGIEGYAYSESTGGKHFVDDIGGNLIFRLPLGESGVAPYVFGGGGRQIDPVTQWNLDAGGGVEWRFTDHVGVFVDARYVWADKTDDYGLGRLGLKFGF